MALFGNLTGYGDQAAQLNLQTNQLFNQGLQTQSQLVSQALQSTLDRIAKMRALRDQIKSSGGGGGGMFKFNTNIELGETADQKFRQQELDQRATLAREGMDQELQLTGIREGYIDPSQLLEEAHIREITKGVPMGDLIADQLLRNLKTTSQPTASQPVGDLLDAPVEDQIRAAQKLRGKQRDRAMADIQLVQGTRATEENRKYREETFNRQIVRDEVSDQRAIKSDIAFDEERKYREATYNRQAAEDAAEKIANELSGDLFSGKLPFPDFAAQVKDPGVAARYQQMDIQNYKPARDAEKQLRANAQAVLNQDLQKPGTVPPVDLIQAIENIPGALDNTVMKDKYRAVKRQIIDGALLNTREITKTRDNITTVESFDKLFQQAQETLTTRKYFDEKEFYKEVNDPIMETLVLNPYITKFIHNDPDKIKSMNDLFRVQKLAADSGNDVPYPNLKKAPEGYYMVDPENPYKYGTMDEAKKVRDIILKNQQLAPYLYGD